MRAPFSRPHGPARLLILLLAGVTGWACRESSRELAASTHLSALPLVDLLDRAEVEHRSVASPIGVRSIEIGFEQQRALLQHPPSEARFTVPVTPESFLSLAPAMIPASWQTESDGVGFEVRCRDAGGEWVDLYSRSIAPVRNLDDQGWQQTEIALAACSSPSTVVELRTTCGEAHDCRWDWAVWGEPQVVTPRDFDTAIERLVLLISIDTLRPDRMGLYGAARATTPELATLAAEGIVFETAVAPAPWTIPSHASLLTSSPPGLHGADGGHDIHAGVPLLSEVLHEAGWSTAGFVDTPWLGSFGFDRGYDHYDAQPPPKGTSRRGAAANRQRLLTWLSDTSGDAFVFWHVMDVHGPYGAPPPYGGRFRQQLEIEPDDRLRDVRQLAYHDYLQLGRFRSFPDLLAAYDEGVLATDAEIGRLLGVLRDTGLYDDALIVVTADHGESLLDHGVWIGHGLFLTDDEIRVPLVIKLPGNRHAGTRVKEMVRLLDVAPTILDILGQPVPPTMSGLSLVDPSPGHRHALPRFAFGTSSNTGAHYVRSNDAKLITEWTIDRQQVIDVHLRPNGQTRLLDRVAADVRFHDLLGDPGESIDLAPSNRWTAHIEDLRRLNTRFVSRVESLRSGLNEPAHADGSLSAEQVQRLRALGYLGGEASP